MEEAERMKNLGVHIGIFFLAVSGVIFVQSLRLPYYSDYGPGPGLLPVWVSGIVGVLSLISLAVAVKKEKRDLAALLPKGEGMINVLTSMGSILLFLVIVSYTGFLIASIAALFFLFQRGYRWHWSLGLSVCVSLVVFFIFEVFLRVPLPANEYGW